MRSELTDIQDRPSRSPRTSRRQPFWIGRSGFARASVFEYDDPPIFSSWENTLLYRPVATETASPKAGEPWNNQVEEFFRGHLPSDAQRIRLVGSIRREQIEGLAPGWDAIGVLQKINNSRWINKFFRAVNSRLKTGGLFVGCIENNHERKRRLFRKYPAPMAHMIYPMDFLIHRVWPKIPLFKKYYFGCTKGHSRPISEAEALGRLVSCGFEIVEHRESCGLMYFVVRKSGEANVVQAPTYGPFCFLRRFGRGETPFTVYKLRTMHPYAEFLQEYVYRMNDLQEGGKFKNDFRIPTWGKWFRRFWLDELPMVLNLLKGEMKLVGVRPLSAHYFSLYPSEVQELRKRHTPGLLPPFYADLPKTFDEIVASEVKYLRAYEQAPFRTDVRYFFTAAWNILVRRARSS